MPSCVIIWRVCGTGRVVFRAVSRRLREMSSCLSTLGIVDSDIVNNILVTQRILKISLIHDIHHSLSILFLDNSANQQNKFRLYSS